MSDGDDRISKRYRELAREEPSAALDASILAASRRAVVAKPSLSRRWGVPVSIAAVLVLGFGLTLEMEHDKPGVSTSIPAARPAPWPEPPPAPTPIPSAAAPAPQESAPVQAAKPQATRAVGSVRSDVELQKKTAPVAKERAETEPMQVAPAMELRVAPAQPPAAPPAAAPSAAAAPAAADSYAAPAANAAAAAPARAKSAVRALESASGQAVAPEQELERIAKLRADGQDAEADRALEDFRHRYPGYRIPDATWERVRPR